ncbi:antibiotic biosynthesis monooxygenase [Streptomyces canus]|uniref:antibiotic biosynthesis monooxygenase family protein n=1 Tax=Streptomyces canus TaxID=58343 RepID=UPI0036E30A84
MPSLDDLRDRSRARLAARPALLRRGLHRRADPGDNGYGETDERLYRLAADQPGFLGVDAARGAGGLGITVSYWRDEDSIAAWRNHAEHTLARAHGREHWYGPSPSVLHSALLTRKWGSPGPTSAPGGRRCPSTWAGC